MYKRSLFAEDQTSARGKDHADTFDEERPLAQVTVHDETGQNGLDFRNARSTRVWRRVHHEHDDERRVDHRPEDEHEVLEEPCTGGRFRDAEDVRPRLPLNTHNPSAIFLEREHRT